MQLTADRAQSWWGRRYPALGGVQGSPPVRQRCRLLGVAVKGAWQWECHEKSWGLLGISADVSWDRAILWKVLCLWVDLTSGLLFFWFDRQDSPNLCLLKS